MPTPQLVAPPIAEVVCGFSFAPFPDLDPVVAGKFWSAHMREAFPRTQVHQAIASSPGLSFFEGVGPLRTWLLSEDDEYLVQIQADRFYFNWRRRSAAYPRFHTRGDQPGVLERGLEYFALFQKFCADHFERRPAIDGIELSKIDLLEQGTHWKDTPDLGACVPVIGHICKLAKSDSPSINLRFFETRGEIEVNVLLTNAILLASARPVLQVEIRARRPASDEGLVHGFTQLNATVNDIFFDTIVGPDLQRFGGTVG